MKEQFSHPLSTITDKQNITCRYRNLTRNGEDQRAWCRSDRFLCIDQNWYFATREGGNVGPFVSRQAVESGLDFYVNNLENHAHLSELSRSKVMALSLSLINLVA